VPGTSFGIIAAASVFYIDIEKERERERERIERERIER
jgi:hypothetical protein